MYKKISDYGIIGNLRSVALIGLDGSIDWLCLPYIDSPSIFGAILDDKKGGCFSISPLGEWDSTAEYIPETNILITKFRTRTGVMQITDFMPIPFGGEEELEEEKHELYRLVEVTKGKLDVRIVFGPQFDYARGNTSLKISNKGIKASKNNDNLVLSYTSNTFQHFQQTLKNNSIEAEWRISDGDRLWFHMIYDAEEPGDINIKKAEKSLNETKCFWQSWLRKSETGRSVDLGHYKEMIDRSALVLKLLYYNPTGTIAAAATTSLPEEIGGVRNWDYRFTWIRDASFTLQALFNLGHLSETQGYIRWLERLLSKYGAGNMQIMYGLRGEDDLPEEELRHLDGYKGSKPVRIGNDAAKQKQLDIYGEIMDAALKLSNYVGKIDSDIWPFLRGICDYVVEHWQDKDSGIWEVRGGPYHFVYSKVMCWVALNRGITIAHRYGFPADLKKWEETCSIIKEEVLNKGYNDDKQAFVQHYDTDALDSSNLLLPILGFLPFNDTHVISTLEATQKDLSHNGFLYRYTANDGLPGGEGTFMLCTFWFISNLIAMNEIDDAEVLLKKIEGTANHLGLFSEEYDINWKESLGNFPQAFTHIGYINSVIALRNAKGNTAIKDKMVKKRYPTGLLLSNKIILNQGTPQGIIKPEDIALKLKETMNILRGAFFDIKKGRVAYEQIPHSDIYREYVELSYNLKNMDLNILSSKSEKLAFWINIYNVIVIHAVIELGVKDSVKEIRNFFRRIQYQISDMFFTPDDIEHGILRGNRRPPHSLLRLFNRDDKRLEYIVKPVDPRIHFTLVCASSSCPPIEVYTAEKLDKELKTAGETFLNTGGIVIKKERNSVSISRIFKWYGGDFSKKEADMLKHLSSYLYKREDRDYIERNADNLTIQYQDYDWRLNRY